LGVLLLVLIVIVALLATVTPEKKTSTVNVISSFNDDKEYNFSVEVSNIEEDLSTLYVCNSSDVPEYLNDLALSIDANLNKEFNNKFLTWSNDNERVLTYNIDSTILDIDLVNYSKEIIFSSVEEFVSQYLEDSIEYFNLDLKEYEDTEIYSGNRSVQGKELRTGFATSDFYVVENGYLTRARILLADIVESDYVAPLITDARILEQYLSNPEYPKEIVLDTTNLYTLNPENYEDFTPEINYESCSITQMESTLYFHSCATEYIYDVYYITGICDVEYRGELFSVPYKGYINAIEPEYIYVQ